MSNLQQLSATVIVPAYNAAPTIGACLAALQSQILSAETQLEIIIVDDCSTDATPTLVEQSGATLLRLPHNQGRSGARNAGAQAASSDILLFTDADCEPLSNWVESMLTPFRVDAAIAGVKGAYLCKQRSLVARFTQLELADKYDYMAMQPQISFIDTYSAAFKRDVFLNNDGFDQAMTYTLLEDQDFSFRLAGRGYKMVFAPGARVYHHHLTSPLKYYRRKRLIGKWKPEILRRHPAQLSSDSRTPLLLKVQFGLAILMTAFLPFALIMRAARRLFAALGGIFLLSAAPFLSKTRQRDPQVMLVAVPMLFIRAAGLGHGFINGTIRTILAQRRQRK